MKFHVVALDRKNNSVLWYTGLPGPGFVRDMQYCAKPFHDELSAQRVVKRLNEFTGLHGYKFITINQKCELQHILTKLRAL